MRRRRNPADPGRGRTLRLPDRQITLSGGYVPRPTQVRSPHSRSPPRSPGPRGALMEPAMCAAANRVTTDIQQQRRHPALDLIHEIPGNTSSTLAREIHDHCEGKSVAALLLTFRFAADPRVSGRPDDSRSRPISPQSTPCELSIADAQLVDGSEDETPGLYRFQEPSERPAVDRATACRAIMPMEERFRDNRFLQLCRFGFAACGSPPRSSRSTVATGCSRTRGFHRWCPVAAHCIAASRSPTFRMAWFGIFSQPAPGGAHYTPRHRLILVAGSVRPVAQLTTTGSCISRSAC